MLFFSPFVLLRSKNDNGIKGAKTTPDGKSERFEEIMIEVGFGRISRSFDHFGHDRVQNVLHKRNGLILNRK